MRHRVRQGEHLSGIAAYYGLASWNQIWEHPENASLRKRRGDPNVLLPGDKIFIPDRQGHTETGTTEHRHRFRLKRPQLLLRIDVRDLVEEFDAASEFRLQIGSDVRDVTPNADGVIEERISPTVTDAALFVDDFLILLRIGHLDPVDVESGQRERLRNLGYLEADVVEDEETIAAAVLHFQSDHDLLCDGICGPQTQQKLIEIHGS